MAYNPLSLIEWYHQNESTLNPHNAEANAFDFMQQYNQYLANFNPTSSAPHVTPNVTMNTPIPTPQSPITPGFTGEPSTGEEPIAPGALAPNPDFAPPDAFNNFIEAGTFGGNQAAGIYAGGSVPKSFGNLSQQSFDKALSTANGNLLPLASNILSSQASSSVNPYALGLQQRSPDSNMSMGQYRDPFTTDYASMARSQGNPYGSKIGAGFESGNFNFNAEANPYTGQVAGAGGYNPFRNAAAQGQNNPYASFFQELGGQSNPYTNQLDFDQTNPFLQGFQDFGNMQNEAFDRVLNNAMDKVGDRVNSQFGLAGRTGSGAHQDLLTESLGDVAAGMYSDNFQNNMQRQLQALQSGAGAYDALQGRNLQSLGMGIDAYNQDFGNQLNAFGAASNAWNTDAARNLQGIGMAGDMYASDASRNLDALSTAGTLSADDRDAMLKAMGMTADQFNTDQNRQLDYLTQAGNFANTDFGNRLSAAAQGSNAWLANQGLNQDAIRFNADQFQNSFNNAMNQGNILSSMYQNDVDNQFRAASALPELQTANWQDVNMLNSYGQQWDDTVFYNSNPWTNLNNYANVIATLQGSVPPPEPGVSTTDRLLGLIPMLSLFKD